MTAIPQCWFYVQLFLVDLETGTDTISYNLAPVGIVQSLYDFIPILKDIGNAGSTMGEFLPRGISGDIVLDNSPSSFGYERRISDIFDRYTPVDQLVQIYGIEATDGVTYTAGYTLLHTARCANWRIDNNSSTVRISTDSRTIAKRVVTKVIDSVNFPSAPSKSLGKHLPVVFGADVEVRAIQIVADGNTSPEYAYATTLDSDFPVGGVQTYYAKDASNIYSAINNPATVSTRLFGNTGANADLTVGTLAGGAGIGQVLNGYVQGTTSYVITGGVFKVKGYNDLGATVQGVIQIQLYASEFITYEPGGTALPGAAIGTATINQADWAGNFRGSARFDLEFTFDRPVVLSNPSDYYIVWSYAQNSSTYAYFYLSVDTGGSVDMVYQAANGVWFRGNSVATAVNFGLYGAVFTDTPGSSNPNDQGLGHAYFEVTAKTLATGQSYTRLTNLDLIVAIDGYKDNSGGDITGSASSLIENPVHALTLLDYEWSGSSWIAGRIDTTKYSATHTQLTASSSRYYRKIAGATTGRTFLETAIRNICANSLLRVALVNGASQYLGVYAHGVQTASSAYISDEEAKIIRIELARTDTIVNRATIYYDKRIRDLDTITGSAEGEFTNFAKTLDWYAEYSSLTSELSAISKALYGERLIDDPTYEFLSDSTSAENIAAFLLGHYAIPHIFVQLSVPLFKFNTLDIFDVVTLVHPDLPSYFGTSSNAKPPSYLGQEVVNINETPLRRAKHWRAQIEAREIDFSIRNYPVLILTARLMNNYPADPT